MAAAVIFGKKQDRISRKIIEIWTKCGLQLNIIPIMLDMHYLWWNSTRWQLSSWIFIKKPITREV